MDWAALSVDEAAGKARDETKVRRSFWKTLRRAVSSMPMAEEAAAAYFAALDRRTPVKVQAMLLATLAYFVVPADAVPDILPVIGFTDDAAVLMAALRMLSEHIRPQHYEAAREAIDRLRTDP